MNYHNITKDDMQNGDGLRVVLWVSGCSHCCPGCHNPETWDANSGILFDEAAKAEIIDQLSQSYISGLTITGGDPLYEANRYAINELITDIKIKFPDKTIWLYTGFLYEQIFADPIMKKIDILVDGLFEESKKDNQLHWRGSLNQRVIDVKKSLGQASKEVPVLYKGAKSNP
ncbi:MAG: anaerobic ribonucleoside-triphosphate reductase activating protein [Lachnospiraceae bacterium]|nr:anaerobic ribonucleoside-triphosphate reductase activating protein [Lachnospiraceae bacterium]